MRDNHYSYENTQRELHTAQGTLHYHEAGDGPPLLLLHGSGPGVYGWSNFHGNLPVFARHFRTFILDLPGFGGSSAVDGDPMVAAVAACVHFLDALGIAQISVIGNSMGGIVASHLAAAHPARVLRLCTIGGVGINLFSPFPNEGINLLVEFTEQPSRERLVAWLRSMVYDQALITDALIEERWERATDAQTLEVSRRIYSRAAIQAMAVKFKQSQPWAHLPAITCPTLITWGRDDRVSPVDWAILPMRLIPRCELHVFYDCGHWAMIERKAEFENVVLAFLQR
jgi:2-hydroxy-6-oxonona-2,4-dienedioate hydrolase